MVNSADFGKRLQKIMEEHDLNATSFADAVDVGRSSISHILSGRNKPSLEFVLKVVDAFPEVNIYWLLNGKGTYPNYADQKQPEAVKPIAPKSTPSYQQGLFAEESEQPTLEIENTPTRNNHHDEEIERIVIFYKDGTFKNFLP